MEKTHEIESWRCRYDRFPHASGMRGKKRPALVVQADTYNAKVGHALIAEITTNLNPANDPAFVLIDVATPEGKATGWIKTLW